MKAATLIVGILGVLATVVVGVAWKEIRLALGLDQEPSNFEEFGSFPALVTNHDSVNSPTQTASSGPAIQFFDGPDPSSWEYQSVPVSEGIVRGTVLEVADESESLVKVWDNGEFVWKRLSELESQAAPSNGKIINGPDPNSPEYRSVPVNDTVFSAPAKVIGVEDHGESWVKVWENGEFVWKRLSDLPSPGEFGK